MNNAYGSHSNFMHVSDMCIAWLQVYYMIKALERTLHFNVHSIIMDSHELHPYHSIIMSATQVT